MYRQNTLPLQLASHTSVPMAQGSAERRAKIAIAYAMIRKLPRLRERLASRWFGGEAAADAEILTDPSTPSEPARVTLPREFDVERWLESARRIRDEEIAESLGVWRPPYVRQFRRPARDCLVLDGLDAGCE